MIQNRDIIYYIELLNDYASARIEKFDFGFWAEFAKEFYRETGESVNGDILRKRFFRRIRSGQQEFGIDDLLPKDFLTRDYSNDEDGEDVVDTNFKKEPSSSAILHKTKYYYNEITDTYIFHVKQAPKPVVISGDDLKAMKSRYSNWDGVPSSINELCRDFRIPRSWFTAIKDQLGWTHDSEPYTEKEIMERHEDDLIEEVLQDKRRILYQKFEQKKWDEFKIDAMKYREIDATVVKPMQDLIHNLAPKYKPFRIVTSPLQLEDYALVFTPMDVHVGKLPFISEAFDPDQFDRDVETTIKRMFDKVVKFGMPREIIAMAGSDFFHIDNTQHSTSALTSQAGQMHGSYHDVIVRGYLLGFKIWDYLADFTQYGTKVKTLHIAGNHDKATSLQLSLALSQRYRGNPNMTFDYGIEDRKLLTYGNNLIIGTHGEFMKRSSREKDIMQTILLDSKKKKIDISNVDNFYHFSGHVHGKSVSPLDASISENGGILDIVVPSLSVTDLWHHNNKYEGNQRCVSSYVLDPIEGLTNIIYQKII
jgi:hypothetical protein